MTHKALPYDAQVLKGILTMVLLRLLAQQESYGYELVTRLHAGGFPDIQEGTVYPALSRLEREGLLESRLVASNSGPARKYYRLSAAGLDALAQSRASWRDLTRVVNALLDAPAPDSPATDSPRSSA